MMTAIIRWFIPDRMIPTDDRELRELTEQRRALIAQAKANSALATSQALDLIEETTSEKLRLVEAKESRERMAIHDLLGKMNGRLY